MEIRRFFVSPQDVSGDVLTIRGREAAHAIRVLRQKVGYKIVASSGDGNDIFATITDIGKDELVAKIDKIVLNPCETRGDYTLFQCVAKETDFIVQKAVELGFKHFIPVINKFVSSKATVERWRTIALDASKQCGRAVVMDVAEPIDFCEAVTLFNNYDVAVLPYESATFGSLKNAVAGDDSKAALIIGSEGGFTEEEVKLAESYGAKTVTLGKRILRAETAAVSAMTLLLEYEGELQ